MKSKSNISVRTKKILLGTGIAFGTVLVFVVSFFLAFTLIVNPISFNTFGSDDVAAENEELKAQVETLEGEVDQLNSTVLDYERKLSQTDGKKAEEQPQPTPSTVTTPAPSTEQTPVTPQPSENEETLNQEEEFAPDTVTTPEGGFEEEIEPDITVIDVSE